MGSDPTIFNRDGTISRKRKHACKRCGAMEECDECWEHVSDYSPFAIFHCLLCRMPKATYKEWKPVCDFCGWGGPDDLKTVTP